MNFKGVSWHKLHCSYQATIYHSGKQHHLGYFSCPNSASEAYQVEKSKAPKASRKSPTKGKSGSYIVVNDRRIHAGFFDTKVEAEAALTLKLSNLPLISSSTTNERCDQMSRIEEKYSTAINSGRSLKLSPSSRGSVDVLIAGGLSKYKFGLSLMRLRSEWDSGHDQMSRMNRLVSLPAVRDHFTEWSAKKRIPKDSCILALIWWLDHVCKSCEGRGFNVIPDTPMLSDTPCSVCHGSGSTYLPDVEGIKRALDHIQQSVDDARRSMSYRLRSTDT